MKSRIELNHDKQKEIEKEKRKEHQKKVVKVIIKIFFILFMMTFILCFYITKVATVKLIVQEEVVSSSTLPNSFHGLKVIQFSDVHYENRQLLKDVVESINLRKPDLVFFTGDLLKGELTIDERATLTSELKKIEATLGKYAVLGEADDENAISILTDCGFTILNDQYDLIYKDSIYPILLIGLNTNYETNHYEQAFGYYQIPEHNETIFSIALFHKPDKIDEILNYHSVDVALAGHSHGGEITIPKLVSLVNKEGAQNYNEAFYQINNTKFYISSGIGTSEFPCRFFARPSITFLRFMKIG